MSPEHARGEAVDARSDLYALGCVAYQMVAGEPPLNGATPMATLLRQVNDEPTPLTEVAPGTPAWYSDLVDALLAKDPADRPADASAVVAGVDVPQGDEAAAASAEQSDQDDDELDPEDPELLLLEEEDDDEEELVTAPVEELTLPEELDTLPDELDTLPEELDTAPVDDETLPEDETAPVEDETLPEVLVLDTAPVLLDT